MSALTWQTLNWKDNIDTGAKGLCLSYAALAFSIPAYYICALAIASERANLSGQTKALVPPLPFSLAAFIYLLTPAIFTACIIFAMGLSVLLIGVVQIGGAA